MRNTSIMKYEGVALKFSNGWTSVHGVCKTKDRLYQACVGKIKSIQMDQAMMGIIGIID